MSDDKDWSCDDYPDYCDEDGNPLDEYADKDEDELDDKDEDDDGKDETTYASISEYIAAEYTDYDY